MGSLDCWITIVTLVCEGNRASQGSQHNSAMKNSKKQPIDASDRKNAHATKPRKKKRLPAPGQQTTLNNSYVSSLAGNSMLSGLTDTLTPSPSHNTVLNSQGIVGTNVSQLGGSPTGLELTQVLF